MQDNLPTLQEREAQLRRMERFMIVPILYRYSRSGRTYFDLSTEDAIQEILLHEYNLSNPLLIERTQKSMATIKLDTPEEQKNMAKAKNNANPARFSRVAAMAERELIELLLDDNAGIRELLAYHLKWLDYAGPMLLTLYTKYARELVLD